MTGLLLVTGPPGAGKSTVAELLATDAPRSALVAGDAFFAFLRRGAVAPWLPEARAQDEVVTEAAAAATGHLVRGGLDVVYDGVVGPWLLPRFLAATGLPELDYAVVLPDEDECVARVAARTGHGFTDLPATRHMHRDFRTAGIAPRHVVGTGSPEEVADQVRARWAQGRLVVGAG